MPRRRSTGIVHGVPRFLALSTGGAQPADAGVLAWQIRGNPDRSGHLDQPFCPRLHRAAPPCPFPERAGRLRARFETRVAAAAAALRRDRHPGSIRPGQDPGDGAAAAATRGPRGHRDRGGRVRQDVGGHRPARGADERHRPQGRPSLGSAVASTAREGGTSAPGYDRPVPLRDAGRRRSDIQAARRYPEGGRRGQRARVFGIPELLRTRSGRRLHEQLRGRRRADRRDRPAAPLRRITSAGAGSPAVRKATIWRTGDNSSAGASPNRGCRPGAWSGFARSRPGNPTGGTSWAALP